MHRALFAYIERGTKWLLETTLNVPLKKFKRATDARLLPGIFSDDPLSYLCGRHAVLMHFIGLQGFAHADGALRGVRVLKAAMQALVSHVHVAIAVARKLRERIGNLLGHFVSILRRPYEFVWREGWSERARAFHVRVIRRDASLRLRRIIGRL